MSDDDEDILDSWEDAADTGDLERRMEEKISERNNSQEKIDMDGPITILKAESTGRTEYTPQIKILKRAGINNDKSNKPRNKTEAEMKVALKMKEAEYKAARNRILGVDYDETKPKLDNDNVKISIIQNTTRAWSVNIDSSPPTQKSFQDSEVIIRQPSGPDDSRGFKTNR